MIFIQITDHDGVRYQSHGAIELSKLGDDVKTTILDYSQGAFFLPGDYQLAIAILDTTTGEHSSRQMPFGVDPLQHELLPGAWRDLPSVEFIGGERSPTVGICPAFTAGCGGTPLCTLQIESTSFSRSPLLYRSRDRVPTRAVDLTPCFPRSKCSRTSDRRRFQSALKCSILLVDGHHSIKTNCRNSIGRN